MSETVVQLVHYVSTTSTRRPLIVCHGPPDREALVSVGIGGSRETRCQVYTLSTRTTFQR